MAALLLAAPAAAGPLVIAGGGLDASAPAIHAAFLTLAPPTGPIVIVPSASAAPAESARLAAEALTRAGADPARLAVARVAEVDDPATPGVDEARWAGGAWSADEVARVAGAAGLWFTGGDQARTGRLLLRTDGDDTPLLAAMRARAAAGAVVGGTSAGAAMMGRAMILRGDARAAAAEQLAVGHGLGFLPRGLTDQHFHARGRLPRLVRALAALPAAQRIGWGVDEDTALVIDGGGRARVVGSGAVTLVDARRARFAGGDGPAFAATGLRVTVAGGGSALAVPRD